MHKRIYLVVIFFIVVGLNFGSAQNQVNQELLIALNFFRTQPQLAIDSLLKPLIPMFEGKKFIRLGEKVLLTKEGVKPLLELIAYLENYQPTLPLTYSTELEKAANELAVFQSKTGYTGHSVVKGKKTHDRIRKYNKKFVRTAECIAYGYYKNDLAQRAIIQLLVDDGVRNRGHRIIMLSEDFSFMGAAVKSHRKYEKVVVLNFANL
jgi:uncharacterized protein YkwD